MIQIKTPAGRKSLDDMFGPELRDALRAVTAQFGAAKAALMIWQEGLPALPSPLTPHYGRHSRVAYRK